MQADYCYDTVDGKDNDKDNSPELVESIFI